MGTKLSKIIFYCLAISCLTYGFGAQQTFSAATQKIVPAIDSLQDINEIVEHVLNVFHVPGAAIGVVVDGKIIMSKGFGMRNLSQNLPATENTQFAIGSCTKAFTAFILGQLVDEGKITWDDPVIYHIPEFRMLDQYTTHHLTIRDLIAHRSGLARHDCLCMNQDITRADIIKCLQYLEPVCKLREKFHYNNLMYAVAGILIEKITGQTWEDNLASRIFSPLFMLNSNASLKKLEESEDHSMPYAEIGGDIKTLPFRNIHSIASAGAINSSVSDMIKWMQLQLSEGNLCGKNFICKETLQEMHTIQMPMTIATPDDEVYLFGYGLGWCTGIYRGHYYLQHSGKIDGFTSQVSLIPQSKIGVVILCNSGDGFYTTSTLTNTIIDKLLGQTNVDWLEKCKYIRELTKKAAQEVTNESDEVHSNPSHPLEEYVGFYEHPAYGMLQVKLQEGELFAIYADMVMPLHHKCYDVFKGKIDEALLGDKITIDFSFLSNTSGEIDELSIPLEITVKPIVFKRKAGNELFTKHYLKQFEGVFGNGISVEILLRGDKLIMIQSNSGIGQQEYELIPEKKFKFNLKGLPGHSIQFVLGDHGEINELIFVFPLGSLSFNRYNYTESV